MSEPGHSLGGWVLGILQYKLTGLNTKLYKQTNKHKKRKRKKCGELKKKKKRKEKEITKKFFQKI